MSLVAFQRTVKTISKKMPAPPISALEQVAALDRALVDQVWNCFLADVTSHSNLYDPADIETVRTNPWQVERFLLEAKLNADAATRALIRAQQWRKEQRVLQMTSADFPAEYYQSGYIVRYGRDVSGATVLIFRANIHRKAGTEWNELIKRFFIYQIEQIDAHNDGKGVALLIDCSGIGMANLDLDLLKFIVTSFSAYYPKLFDTILVHELPYLLTYVFKLVQSWLPEDDRKFFHLSTKKTISNYIAKDEMATFLGGSNSTAWWQVPDGVLPADKFVQSTPGFKAESAEKLRFLSSYMK